MGCTAKLGSLCCDTLEKCPNCGRNHIAFSNRSEIKAEAARAAWQRTAWRMFPGRGDLQQKGGEAKQRWSMWRKRSQRGRKKKLQWPWLRTPPPQKLDLRPKQEPWPPMTAVIQHNCARLYEWTIAALEMGIDHKADVLCSKKPQIEWWGIRISNLAYEIRNKKECGRGYRRGVAWWMMSGWIYAGEQTTMVLSLTPGAEGWWEQELSMITVTETRSRERDRHKSWTSTETFGRAEQSLQETLMPNAVGGARGAARNGILPSAKR